MIGSYRAALSLPGAKAFVSAGFVARLPIAMIGLGIVILVSSVTGSYAVAGLLAAAFQVSAAVGAVMTSRGADRWSQRSLLIPLSIVHAIGLIALVASIQYEWALGASIAFAMIAGIAQPAIGSMVRARWAAVSADTSDLRAGFALESILDEIIFAIGPLATSLLAFAVALPLPLVFAAGLTVTGSIALAFQRRTEPARSESTLARPSPVRSHGLVFVLVSSLGLGGVFGAYEVAVVAFASEAGAPAMSGVILALWAVGSGVAGFVYGGRHFARPLVDQSVILMAVMTIVLVPVPFIGSLAGLAIATALGGMCIAPALIVLFSLTHRLVPRASLTEGLAWTNSALAVGYAAGAWLAGFGSDLVGSWAGFALAVAFAVLGTSAVVIGRPRLLAWATRPEPA